MHVDGLALISQRVVTNFVTLGSSLLVWLLDMFKTFG